MYISLAYILFICPKKGFKLLRNSLGLHLGWAELYANNKGLVMPVSIKNMSSVAEAEDKNDIANITFEYV